MVTGIIIAAAVVGILGILIGVFLGIASEKFKVEVDEKEILVRNELPGNNCGKGNRSRPGGCRRMSCGRRFHRGENRSHHGRCRRSRREEGSLREM